MSTLFAYITLLTHDMGYNICIYERIYMKQYNSPKEMNKEELRQALWHYLQDNPMTIYHLTKETGISQMALQAFMEPDTKRLFGLNILLAVNKFLRNKYKERDAQISKDQGQA